MDASIIAVGTELLFGQTVNTNAAELSARLNQMGFNVMYHHAVGDNPGRLEKLIRTALAETELLVLTGGLGPTQDDLTKETVAKIFEAPLVLHEESLAEIKTYFASRDRMMSENNVKQAYLPEGSAVFRNERGTAPAFALEKDGCCVVCLPGPPREMRWLFSEHVEPFLRRFCAMEMVYRVIRTIGIGESDLETRLLPLIDGQTDPTIATYAKEGECALRVASRRKDRAEAEASVNEMLSRIEETIGDVIYSIDNEELNEVVVRKLKERKLRLASAESCTGGQFAAAVTDVAGASTVFSHGFVTYSAAAKRQMLSVPEEVLRKHGEVSAETAEAMARGACRVAGADLAVSVTGYAGPETDEEHEAGTAFLGYVFGEKCGVVFVRTKRQDRAWNRNFFRLKMLQTVNELLDGRR